MFRPLSTYIHGTYKWAPVYIDSLFLPHTSYTGTCMYEQHRAGQKQGRNRHLNLHAGNAHPNIQEWFTKKLALYSEQIIRQSISGMLMSLTCVCAKKFQSLIVFHILRFVQDIGCHMMSTLRGISLGIQQKKESERALKQI